jgi:hypothetical protein
MASLGDLVVNLTANTSNFQKGMASASSTVTKLGAAAAALGGVAVVRLAQVGDMFDKMSKRTGIAVEELSRFKFAAEQSGSSIQSVETGLRKMANAIQDLERGGANVTQTMTDLGLSAADLTGKTQTEQFMTFAEALSGIEDPGRRAALTMDIFGKSGAELIPLLQEGAGGFQALSDESDALGGTVTKLQAKLGADMTDALNRVKVATDGLFRVVATHLAPAVIMVTNAFANMVAFSQGYGRAMVMVGAALVAAAAAFKIITLAQMAYAKAAAVAAAFTGPAGWKLLAGATIAAAAGVAAVTVATSGLNAELESIQPAAATAITDIDEIAVASTEAEDRIGRLRDIVRDGFDSMLTPMQTAQDSINRFRQAVEETNALGGQTLIEKFVEHESGFSSMMQNATDQLAIMRGEATETGLALGKMLELGVDPAKVAKLQEVLDAQAAITAQADNAKKAAEAAEFWKSKENELKAQADAIYAANETPAEKLQKEINRVNDLVKNGVLDQGAAEKYIQGLQPEEQKAKASDPQFAGAMQRGSAEAFKTILSASRKSPELTESMKQTKLLQTIANQDKKNAQPKVAPEFA